MRRLGHHRPRLELLVQCDQHRLGPRDRAEQRQHEVGEDVAVPVQRRNHERVAARRQQ